MNVLVFFGYKTVFTNIDNRSKPMVKQNAEFALAYSSHPHVIIKLIIKTMRSLNSTTPVKMRNRLQYVCNEMVAVSFPIMVKFDERLMT